MKKKAKKQSDKLNPREAKAVALLKSGKAKTKTEALKKAGYSDSVAETRQAEVLGKPRVQSALLSAFDKIGVDDTYLAQKHKELIEAELPATQYSPACLNAPARAKGLDMMYKLKGDYAPEKFEGTVESYADRMQRLREENKKRHKESRN
jgi:hypothetical protein